VKISVIGTGYVGLVSAVCFAELGHEVIGVDIDANKVKMLQCGKSPIYEPEVEDLLARNLNTGRLRFTTDLKEALPGCRVVFSAVATPPNADFSADLRAVFTVAETVAKHAGQDLVFVNKSTVPVGTGKECEALIEKILKARGEAITIPVVSNPEFLREGHAVHDTMQPDRIIVGLNGDSWPARPCLPAGRRSPERSRGGEGWAKEIMEEIYHPLTRTGKPIVWMNRESAEIVKYASNAFLATKISFINMMSELAEKTGANVRDIARGMGMDDRIGPRFLHAGIGYGGSCFPKDVKALIALSRATDVPMPIVEATHQINQHQRERFFKKILATLPKSATVALWGLSFKPRTDDMREAPSLDLIPMLLSAGHSVTVHDPVSMENTKKIIGDTIGYSPSPIEATKNADAVVILTEWDAFRGIDLKELKESMKGNMLFDGRNIYTPEEVKEAGLLYYGVGMPVS